MASKEFSSSSISSGIKDSNSWDGYTPTTISAEILLVAGGGGGGSYGGEGGGGGAGGLLYYGTETPKTANGTAQTLTSGTTYTITVGPGGTGATSWTPRNNTDGSNTSMTGTGLSLTTAVGGGSGGCYPGDNRNNAGNGNSGGSGGGGGGNYSSSDYGHAGGTGTSGQGNNGGAGSIGSSGQYRGGGGGGARWQGITPPDYAPTTRFMGGVGGEGLIYNITGIPTGYASGGSGNTNGGETAPAPSYGGGTANGGGNAAANTGGGGGAGINTTYPGGNGGSGVVIIRVNATAASTTGSPTVTTVNGFKVYKFTGDGTITF